MVSETRASPFRLVTFNAGLAVGVLPHATERVPRVIEALASLEADLLFVQEFWLETHYRALREATAERFPYALRPPPAIATTGPSCTADELAPLLACARAHCGGLEGHDLGRCVIAHCAAAAAHLSTPCLNCITSHPVGSIEQILEPCIGAALQHAPRDTKKSAHVGWGPPGLVAYGGSFGTALLSRVPLVDEDVLVFEATLNARCAIHARVEAPFGPLHVFATHLSPGIEGEQRVQIDRLFAWIDEHARGAPTVVLGDLNTGPSLGNGVQGHLAHLYARFEDAGFENPYRSVARCTWCHGSLSSGSMGSSGWLLDHVLLRDVPAEARAERILDEPITIESSGRRVRTTYSDHCGVRVTLLSDSPAPPRAAGSSRPAGDRPRGAR